ncbi:GNAT family N-acetyltransferase [Cohnella cholangitidis]|nr:GNAT family N-acetyltransferase [Cohnella cholangitidis]
MHPVTIRNYERGDFAKLISLQALCFPPPFPSELWWNEEQLSEHVTRFPEGALCAELEGEIVGSMTALRITLDDRHTHDWASVTDEGYIRNHEPTGDTLYVVDICVAPGYRKLGLGKWLMQSMYETVVHLGCNRLLGGGRMPGYHLHAGKLTPQQYVDEVTTGGKYDPVLTFLLNCGRLPVGIIPDYLDDEQSAHYAALMEWRNPFK